MTPTPDAAASGEYSALPSLLRTTLEATLDPLIPLGGPVALIDVPNHDNCGDNAILVGELSYLKRRGSDIRMLADHRGCTQIGFGTACRPAGSSSCTGVATSGPAGPTISGCGGGSFATSRTVGSSSCPNRSGSTGRKPSRPRPISAVTSNSPFLFVTRPACLPRVRNLGSRPPCVPMLRSNQRRAPENRRQGTLLLLRVDGGAVSHPPDSIQSVDWPPERGSDHFRRMAMRLADRAGPSLAAAARFSAILYPTAAERRTEDALRMLDRSELVCTDRLHVLILGLCPGVPLVLVPEKTGKLQSFHQTWLTDHAGTTMAKDLSDGLQCVSVEMSTPGPLAEREGTAATVRKLHDRAHSLLMGG